ncbi:energy-coupling factor ABC transporter ATP-binding protein [Paenibacillus massiliensis]|uniref:energy-coupling factor ABC transporter ATP-binding protein n=1 Tax=Paenibacillus massiliensis TaxID=225917 RepID=UPI0004729154|nr:ABC transporter ATP-binding protein [Paenibacillus massiliensis]
MKFILEWSGVSYLYPYTRLPALSDLSVAIPQGSRAAIIGHNGSGKSTMLLHAVGLVQPSEGSVEFAGARLGYSRKQLAALRQRVGLVLQDPEQQIIMNTPLADIAFGLRNLGLDEVEIGDRTRQVLELLRLQELAEVPVHHLSLGQKKRTALAGILAVRPEVLLLDEPTSYLDPHSEQMMLQGLAEVHAAGTTVVMATHDMDLAYSWADWVIVLEKGTCRMQGHPEDVLTQQEMLEGAGLALPLLVELWLGLPQELRRGRTAPRSKEHMKKLLRECLTAQQESRMTIHDGDSSNGGDE